MFKNCLITFYIRTPILFKESLPTIDSLILSQLSNIDNVKNDLSNYVNILEFENHWVPQASRLFPMDGNLDNTIIYSKFISPKNVYILNKVSKLANQTLDPSRRKFKTAVSKYKSLCTTKLVGAVKGNSEKIESLLKKIKNIGSKHNIGYGEISDFNIEIIESDNKLFGIKNTKNDILRPISDTILNHLNMIEPINGQLIEDKAWPPYSNRFPNIRVPTWSPVNLNCNSKEFLL